MSARRRIETALPKILAWGLLCFLFVPILVVIPVALTDRDYLSLPQDGMSLDHFAALADWSKGWLPAMLTSAAIAAGCSALATALGVAFAVGAWSAGGWWPSSMRILLLSPMIVPPIIYAVGMVKLWAALSLLDTYVGVILVHVVLALPLTVMAIGASLSNLDQRLVQAARSLGARPMTVFTRVILPNIVPGVAAGALLAFVVSWDEITVTLFITGRAVITLPRLIWTSIEDAVDPALAAIASVLLLVTILALVARSLAGKAEPGKTI